MGLVLSDARWLEGDQRDPVVAAGKLATVTVSLVAARTAVRPVFTNYELLGYVASGSVEAFVIDLADKPRGQVLPEGSFFRVPATLIHWFRNRGDRYAVLMTVLVDNGSEPWGGDVAGTPLAADWEDPADFMRATPAWPADPGRYPVSEDDEKGALASPPNGLFRTPAEVDEFRISHHLVVPLRTKVVAGRGASIMVAERPGTYHSTPHIHAAEQINIQVEGLNWKYCVGPDGRYAASQARAGDIFRFPNMVPHWAWGRDGGGSKVVEFHVPGLHGDPDFQVGLVTLLSDDDNLEPSESRARNIFLDNAAIPIAAIEGTQ